RGRARRGGRDCDLLSCAGAPPHRRCPPRRGAGASRAAADRRPRGHARRGRERQARARAGAARAGPARRVGGRLRRGRGCVRKALVGLTPRCGVDRTGGPGNETGGRAASRTALPARRGNAPGLPVLRREVLSVAELLAYRRLVLLLLALVVLASVAAAWGSPWLRMWA